MSNVVTSAAILDLVRMVYLLQDFQEITPPPRMNTYRLVAFISSAYEIQLESLYPSNHLGYPV
jgi:hypothetical protein